MIESGIRGSNQEAAHIWVMEDVNKELSNFSKGIPEYNR